MTIIEDINHSKIATRFTRKYMVLNYIYVVTEGKVPDPTKF